MDLYIERGDIFHISGSFLGWGKNVGKRVIHEHENCEMLQLSLVDLIIHHKSKL